MIIRKFLKANVVKVAWVVTSLVVVLAIFGWGPRVDWNFSDITAYSLFPLFGLLAFSIMWSHYFVGAIRRFLKVEKSKLKPFYSQTGWLVLALIVLHPTLLIYKLNSDGFGLPPASYLNNYVAPSLKWAVTLGTFSLLIFLAYEAKRWFEKKNWWRFVNYANIVAMVGILVHSLKLGADLQSGWLRTLWIFYAVTFVFSVSYNYWFDKQNVKLS